MRITHMASVKSGELRRFAAPMVAGFALLFLGVGTAGPASASDGLRTKRVLLLEKPPFVGNSNPKPGDVLLFQEPALDESGRRIGDSVTRIQAFQNGKYLLDCMVRMSDGNLVFSGEAELPHRDATSTFAVTGGTSHFSGATGDVVVTHVTLKGAGASLLTFHLP